MRRGILFGVLGLLTVTGLAILFSDSVKGILGPLSNEERKLAEARTKLPLVSLQDRLPKGKPIAPAKALSADAQKHWETLETYYGQSDRGEMLKALHEGTRNIFVDRPGAGMRRMMETPEDILLAADQGETDQRGEPAYFPLSEGDLVSRVQPDADFLGFHISSIRTFFPARSFGYAKDRDHVAGFKPHGFRHAFLPETESLRVDHVLLIGILKHDQPVVYMTEKLPSMDKIHLEKARPLDLFEEAGLSSLRAGDDLHIASKETTFRMVGALRATKTCQKCHDAEIGDLLGAFSYTLRPTPKDKKSTESENKGTP